MVKKRTCRGLSNPNCFFQLGNQRGIQPLGAAIFRHRRTALPHTDRTTSPFRRAAGRPGDTRPQRRFPLNFRDDLFNRAAGSQLDEIKLTAINPEQSQRHQSQTAQKNIRHVRTFLQPFKQRPPFCFLASLSRMFFLFAGSFPEPGQPTTTSTGHLHQTDIRHTEFVPVDQNGSPD